MNGGSIKEGIKVASLPVCRQLIAVGLQFASSEAGTEGVADACWPPIGRCIRGSNRGEIMPGLSVCEEREEQRLHAA